MKLLTAKKFYGIDKPHSDVVYTKNFYFSEVLGFTEVSVFGMLEVRAPHPDTLAIFNSFIQILQRNLFNGKVEETFEQSLKLINEEFDKIKSIAKARDIPPIWFKTFSAFFGVAYGRELFASSTGGIKCYLARDEELEEVSSDNEEYFSSINSGSIKNEDKIIVLSSESSVLINPDRIALVSREGLESIRFLIESTFLNFEQKQKTFDGLLLTVNEYETPDPIGEPKQTRQNTQQGYAYAQNGKPRSGKGSPQEFINYVVANGKAVTANTGAFLKDAYSRFVSMAFTKENISPRNRATNAIEKIQNPSFIDIVKEKLKFRFLTPFGKIFFSVVTVLSLIIIAFTITSISDQNDEEFASAQRDLLSDCRENLTRAETRILQQSPQNYEELAQSELAEAERLCNEIELEDIEAEKQELLASISRQKNALSGVVVPEDPPGVIADFATVEDVPASFDILPDGAVVTYGQNGIYRFSAAEEVAQIQAVEASGFDGVGTVISSASDDEGAFTFFANNSNQVFRYNVDSNTVEERPIQSGNYPIANFLDVYTRGGMSLPTLYLANIGSNQLYSFNPTNSGFSTGTARFEGKDFSNLVGVDIDGNIILTKSTGEVEVYLGSTLTVSKNILEGTPLETASRAYKNAFTESFYVADFQNKLIGVYTVADGDVVFERSINFSQIDGAVTDFKVAESQGKALLVSGDKIYSVNLI